MGETGRSTSLAFTGIVWKEKKENISFEWAKKAIYNKSMSLRTSSTFHRTSRGCNDMQNLTLKAREKL